MGTLVVMLENSVHILKTFYTWLLSPVIQTSVYFCWTSIISNISSGIMETEQQASHQPLTEIIPELAYLQSAFSHPSFKTHKLLTRSYLKR